MAGTSQVCTSLETNEGVDKFMNALSKGNMHYFCMPSWATLMDSVQSVVQHDNGKD